MLEIRKFSDSENNADKILVGVFEKDEILDFAGYIVCDDKMLVTDFSCKSDNVILCDSLIKTLIYYADISKIRFLVFDKKLEFAIKNYNFDKSDDKLIIDLFKQDTNSNCCCGR